MMIKFKKKILRILLEHYEANLSAGYEPKKKEYSEILELQKCLRAPQRFRCNFRSGKKCLYSISPHHLKRCVGSKNCLAAKVEKKKKHSILFE